MQPDIPGMQKETPGMAVPGAWGAHMALISFSYANTPFIHTF